MKMQEPTSLEFVQKKEEYVSLCNFLLGLFLLISHVILIKSNVFYDYYWYVLAVNILFVNFLTYFVFKLKYDVAIRALILGIALSFGVIISTSGSSFRLFGWYIVAISFFHWSEYYTTAKTNPRNLSLQSYLLDHSTQYYIAALASLIEFSVEWFFFTELKQPNILSILGLIVVVCGELLRKISMFTASTNFNHYVQYSKSDDHQLITHGVYSYFRHPAYVGWFYWSIGTQLMLCNPLCFVAYIVVSWNFFADRIYEEEVALITFFKEDYINYQKAVPTGLPFIHGFNNF